jgi:hypothetical protein
MSAKNPVVWISIFVIALLAGLGAMRAQTGPNTDAVATITALENDGVKADLAGDKSFYQKILVEDWTWGHNEGTWGTKADLLKNMADPQDHKIYSEKISDLKVRVYGSTAVATYKDSSDMMMTGQRRAKNVITTDTYVKMGGEWKLTASHESTAK